MKNEAEDRIAEIIAGAEEFVGLTSPAVQQQILKSTREADPAPGQSVLDGMRYIRAHLDPGLSVRHSCINANIRARLTAVSAVSLPEKNAEQSSSSTKIIKSLVRLLMGSFSLR